VKVIRQVEVGKLASNLQQARHLQLLPQSQGLGANVTTYCSSSAPTTGVNSVNFKRITSVNGNGARLRKLALVRRSMLGGCGAGHERHFRGFIPGRGFVAIFSLLAVETQSGPGDGGQAPCADFLFAIEAGAESALVDPLQGSPDFAELARFPLQTSDGHVSLGGVLDLVEQLCAGIDSDHLAAAQGAL